VLAGSIAGSVLAGSIAGSVLAGSIAGSVLAGSVEPAAPVGAESSSIEVGGGWSSEGADDVGGRIGLACGAADGRVGIDTAGTDLPADDSAEVAGGVDADSDDGTEVSEDDDASVEAPESDDRPEPDDSGAVVDPPDPAGCGALMVAGPVVGAADVR